MNMATKTMELKTNGIDKVKVGSRVMWKGGFGNDPAREAVILSIELCEHENSKYGRNVLGVDVRDLYRCCVGLANGHWAYGYQITELLG